MENRRSLIRLNGNDFLELKPLNEVGKIEKGKVRDFSLMGICFSSELEFKKGQVLLIDYFISDELDSVKIKMVVAWSEFIDPENGYFCGGQIINLEEDKHEKFCTYYYRKLKERLLP